MRKDKASRRHAIWIMTGPRRGAFYRGDCDSVDGPQWDIEQLERLDFVNEVSPEAVLNELQNWPQAQEHAKKAFERHPTEALEGR